MKRGLYKWNYISSMQSEFHWWFQLNGYPELDILRYNDGEWAIIQYYNAPIIPSMTRWQIALGTMRNVDPSEAFLLKYIKQIDLHRKEFWAREEAKTREVEEEHERVNRHREESAEIAAQAVIRNERLMDRIARNGLQEMDLTKIAEHVPKWEVGKPKKIIGVVSNGLHLSGVAPNKVVPQTASESVSGQP